MIDRISIGLDISDGQLRQQLCAFIDQDSLLCLSNEQIPYPEEIIVSDNSSYTSKTGEVLIAVGFKSELAFAQVEGNFAEITQACRRATCYWETASTNRSSVDSWNRNKNVLEELASKLLDTIKDKESPSNICKAIVSDMPIAMILIDSAGYVSMLNSKAQLYFQGFDVSPLSRLAEVVLPDEFNCFLNESQQESCEIVLNGNIITLQKFSIPIANNEFTRVLLFY
jgi:hypothetical protein